MSYESYEIVPLVQGYEVHAWRKIEGAADGSEDRDKFGFSNIIEATAFVVEAEMEG